MTKPINIATATARKERRGTYRYASLVLDAWDRMFGADDAQATRERRREIKDRRSEVEQRAKQRL